MSRPAVPESETPETDKFRDEFHLSAQKALLESHERLERRLSLAQTEIKGHMRVEKELKARCEMYQGWVDRLHGNAEQAQARIAELEKTLSRVIAEADRDTEAFKAAREAFRDRA